MQEKIGRYHEAMDSLKRATGLIPVVPLILAIPIERRGKSLLARTITSDYRTKERPNHNGVDFNGGPWAEGYTTYLNYLAPGAEVTRAEFNSSYGNVIDISAFITCAVGGNDHSRAEVKFRYAHCHELFATKGQRLELFEKFATLGSTGDSTGAHKHFEVWVNGVRINPHRFSFIEPRKGGNNPMVEYYTVKPGDVAYRIASQHGITLEVLKAFNPHIKDWNKIYPGDLLRVRQPNPGRVVSQEDLEEIGRRIEKLETKFEAIKKVL